MLTKTAIALCLCACTEATPVPEVQAATSAQPTCDQTENVRKNWLTTKHPAYGGGSPEDRGFRAAGECLRTLRESQCKTPKDTEEARQRIEIYFRAAERLGFTEYACADENPRPIAELMVVPPPPPPPPLTDKEKKARAAEDLKHAIQVRKDMADRYDTILLNQRMDATARATGKNGTTLYVTYVLCNRVLWSDLAKGFGDSARAVGFKRLVCYDGFNTSVSGDL